MKIALIGYGKMGKAIEEIARRRGHSIVLKASSHCANWENGLSVADVAIEFTRPDAALDNCKRILNHNVPLVSGTTGWHEHLAQVEEWVNEKNGSFIAASNFSVGVNLFFELNRVLAKLMKNQLDYEVSMEEIHHLQKLDAPSGTAISLTKDILSASQQKNTWICSPEAKKSNNQLHINAIRKEGVPGTHTVSYTSDVDEISITHTAKSRDGFALGAVLAAEYIHDKKGFFSMKDVLQLPSFNSTN